MAKLRAKLSLAMRRELEVRRQLGLRPTAQKARGRSGAARAQAELARRQRVARQRRPGWDSLCYELQDMILKHLSIADLANVRIAGLGATSVASRKRLCDMMVRRCRALHPLWKIWTKGTPKFPTSGDRANCLPIEFTSQVQKLVVSPSNSGIPDSICEMRALRYLDVSRPQNGMFLGLPPPLTTLPASLATCQGLLELRMSHHNFEFIPECVLKLRNLRRFEIESNVNLKCLPDDMGIKLENLTFLNMRECRKVKVLPASLLARLEAGITGRQRHRIPLLLSGRCFETDYLKETIVPETYPRLAVYLRNGSLTGPNLDQNNWVFLEGVAVGADEF